MNYILPQSFLRLKKVFREQLSNGLPIRSGQRCFPFAISNFPFPMPSICFALEFFLRFNCCTLSLSQFHPVFLTSILFYERLFLSSVPRILIMKGFYNKIIITCGAFFKTLSTLLVYAYNILLPFL